MSSSAAAISGGAILHHHILDTLSLPSRYEPLVAAVGPEVLQLLLPPADQTIHALEEAAEAVQSLGEGIFLPIHASSGTGKTTLAENLTSFLPTRFTPTLTFPNGVSVADLSDKLTEFTRTLPNNESRVIPINIDHREGNPASDGEVSEIKRFLRQEAGRRALVVWPETSQEIAERMSDAYKRVAGVVPLDIPIHVEGPNKKTWSDLAAQTLLLANGVDSLEYLVNLDAYDPEAYPSLGDYLRNIAFDFNRQKLAMERATTRPVHPTILWVSESSGHGILSSLTSSTRFGMLDPSALLQACGGTGIGPWWSARRGLLVQTIVSLNAHVFGVAPPLSLAVIRRYGSRESVDALKEMGLSSKAPAVVSSYLSRSDLGRHLNGEARSVNETRGNPAEEARRIFKEYADCIGFQGGKDKLLNHAFAEAIQSSQEHEGATVNCESALEFLPSLIPDLSIVTDSGAECLEFTYRKGEFLDRGNRYTIAKYCLEKLKNYAQSMGWVAAGN